MTDFKVNKGLTGEIDALQQAGNSLGEDYKQISSEEVNELDTAMKILEQHATIKLLMELYIQLIAGDVRDMNGFVTEAERMDQTISSSHMY